MLRQDLPPANAAANTADDIYSTQLGAMADIIGGDEIREMIEAFLSESLLTNTKKISVTYLNTLGKLSLDYPRKSVLYDLTLRIGPLKVARKYELMFDNLHLITFFCFSEIFAMSATFGFLPDTFPFQITGPLLLGDPIFGESELTRVDLQGSIVVLQRGVVSFASKVPSYTPILQ